MGTSDKHTDSDRIRNTPADDNDRIRNTPADDNDRIRNTPADDNDKNTQDAEQKLLDLAAKVLTVTLVVMGFVLAFVAALAWTLYRGR